MTTSNTPELGKNFLAEGFELGALVHRGRRSVVQRATRTSDGTKVMLKAATQSASGRAARRRLRHEHAVLERADGHSTVRVHGLASTPLGLSLVLDVVPGVTLRARVSAPRTSLGEFLTLAVACTRALCELHARGVFHLDLRPENILVGTDREARCTLLDLSRAAMAPIHVPEPALSSISELRYIAPEQSGRLGRPCDARTDLFSLGVIFYELLAGALPSSTDDPVEFLHALVAREAPSLTQLRPELPATVFDIVGRLLQKSPDDRYQSAAGLLADLQRCLRSHERNGVVDSFEIGRADHSRELAVSGRVFGRDAELEQLTTRLHEAVRSKGGGVAILGPAGSGKSTLVGRLQAWTAVQRGQFAQGSFDAGAVNDDYGALRPALRPLLRRLLALPSEQLDHWRARLDEAVGARADALLPLFPALESLLSTRPESVELNPIEARVRQQAAVLDLMRAMHEPDAPLVLALDDLQWADPASLELVGGMLRAPELGNPALVLSWRDDELDDSHPLRVIIDDAPAGSLKIVRLGALSPDHVAEMVADTLRCELAEVRALAARVHERASGNPYFVGVLMRSLAAAGALRFDPAAGAWQWRLDDVDKVRAAEGIVPLLTAQLRSLEQESLELLGQVALFESDVDLGLMSMAMGLPLEALAERFSALGRAGVLILVGDDWQTAGELVPGSASDSLAGGSAGKDLFVRFGHDKLRAAARGLLDDAKIPAYHWSFAERLVALGADGWGDEELFLCAEHFDQGRVACPNPEAAKHASASLGAAAQRALAGGAFARALHLAESALSLGGDELERATRFDLHLWAAQSAVVLGHVDARTKHLEAAEPLASDELDRVALDRVQIRAELARVEYTAAVDRTVVALGRLGFKIPRHPGVGTAAALMGKTVWRMRNGAEKLRRLPECRDARVRAAVGLMSEAMIAAYLCEPNLAAVFMLEPVGLTLRHGITPQSPYGVASYAFLRAAQFHDLEGATALGEVAREMVQRLNAKEVAGKVENLLVGFVENRRRRLVESVEGYTRATELALEGGDSTFAGQGAVNAISVMVAGGVEIDHIEEELRPRMALCQRLGQDRSVEWLALFAQLLANLRGKAPDPSRIEGEHMQIEAWLAVHEAGGDKAAPTCLQVFTAMLSAWRGRAAEVLDDIVAAEGALGSLVGTFYCPLAYAYGALARIDAMRDGDDPRMRREVLRNLDRLERWIVEGPVNYAHLRALIRAELADLDGDHDRALRQYDEAIDLAQRTGTLHEAAMSLELAARSLIRRGRGRSASAYLHAARRGWANYGATVDCERFDALEARAIACGADPSELQTAEPSNENLSVDAQIVRRGVQALVGEIRLDALLDRLLTLALQVSGATQATLVLGQGEDARVAADAHATHERIEVSTQLEGGHREIGPLRSVLAYVERTREALLVDDLRADPRFADAFAPDAARALLAAPLVRGGELVGVVVAQQQHVTHAFSKHQRELVSTLATQAAVAIANSLLYENLQAALARQTQLTRAYQRFVPAQFIDHLGKKSILEVRLGDQVQGEFHILFADIRGFSGIAERLGPAETFELINQYLAVMEPAISTHGGYIKEFQGDGILAVFSGSADDAVAGALAMHLALEQLNTKLRAAGRSPLRIGIGINSGRLTFGAIGGQARMANGVVGDAINTASRVEGLCKGYGAGLLISAHTRERLADPSNYAMRRLDDVVVSGRTESLEVWELLDAEPERLRQGKLAGRSSYLEGLEAWGKWDIEGAATAFADALQACPEDRAAKLFLERCNAARSQPRPEGWTGATHLGWK